MCSLADFLTNFLSNSRLSASEFLKRDPPTTRRPRRAVQARAVTADYINYLSNECQADDHKTPLDKTDDVQPIDRGIGRLMKYYIGEFLDKWLDDDDTTWTSGRATSSTRATAASCWHHGTARRTTSSARRGCASTSSTPEH